MKSTLLAVNCMPVISLLFFIQNLKIFSWQAIHLAMILKGGDEFVESTADESGGSGILKCKAATNPTGSRKKPRAKPQPQEKVKGKWRGKHLIDSDPLSPATIETDTT